MIKAFINFLKGRRNEERRLRNFFLDYNKFEAVDSLRRFSLQKSEIFPCLDDNTTTTPFDAHYIYHPAWASRIIKKTSPSVHVDISSTLHFCSIISAFVKTEFYDIRTARLNLDNLKCQTADLTNLFFPSDSISSISCMHTIEHIGLGRYGDPLDPEGDLKAISEIKRVCAVNGNLLLVVPVGIKRLQFNAHRIYSPDDIVAFFDGFDLQEFSLVEDNGEFTQNAALEHASNQIYGCGCFWFKKRYQSDHS